MEKNGEKWKLLEALSDGSRIQAALRSSTEMQEFLFPGKAFALPPPPQETSRFVLCGSNSVAGRLKGAKCLDRLLLISQTALLPDR